MNDIKILLNYNFNPLDIINGDFDLLFKKKRRDSCFAFVYQKNNRIYAIRDHLGIVPLYFRFSDNQIKFSTNLISLMDQNCQFDLEGLKYFIAFGTPKLEPLFKEIKIVPPGSVIKINPLTHEIKIIYQYKIEIPTKTQKHSLSEYINKLDKLLLNALKRTIQFDEVGLYLSGGIDSGLTGIYLKKLGVKVRTYSSAPWGQRSSEIPFIKINLSKIRAEDYYIDFLETNKYKDMLAYIPILYGFPHGTTTGIGVASLWKNTPIKNEKQIYGAQGCDTVTCSVPAQSHIYILDFLPKFIRGKLHKDIKYDDILQNYFSFSTSGLVSDYKNFQKYIYPHLSRINLLSLAGLYVVHTPSDGEVLSGPTINHNILFSNPFYDIDVIKFFLTIPIRFRITFSNKVKTKIYLDKIIVRKLAEKYLPKDLVWRKKGFSVSLERDAQTISLISDIPSNIFGIPLKNNEFKFRAKILFDWSKSLGITISDKI